MLHFNKNTLAGLLAAIMLLTLIMPISLSLSALDEGVSETYLRFEEYGDTSSGTCILVAEYGGKVYAMGNAVVEGQGEDGEKVGYGFEAVEVETLANGEIRVSCDDASICVFTHETVGTKTYIKMSDGTYLNYTDNGLVATGYENLAYFADSLVNGGDFSTCIRLTVKYGEKEITPYFSYVTDTLASQFAFASPFAKDSIYYELACDHTNMQHHNEVPATCANSGKYDYYQCPDCGMFFFDEMGATRSIREEELISWRREHTDADQNKDCDRCSEPMVYGSFVRVTATEDIVVGGRYILVAEVEGAGDEKTYHVMQVPTLNKGTTLGDVKTFPSIEVTPDTDGVVETAEAALLHVNVICDNTDQAISEADSPTGSMRYGLATAMGDNIVWLADGGLIADSCAQFGWYIHLESNGRVTITSVYNAYWDQAPQRVHGFSIGGAIVFSVYAAQTTETPDFVQGLDDFDILVDEGEDHDLYLYRYVESDVVEGKTYTVQEQPSTVSFDAAVAEENQVTQYFSSNVVGLLDAVKSHVIQQAVQTNTVVTGDRIEVLLGADIRINSIAGAGEGRGSMTFVVTPVMILTDGTNTDTITLTPDCLNGEQMTVTVYTGNIYPNQIHHAKPDGTKDYFYHIYDETVTADTKRFEDAMGYVTFHVSTFGSFEASKDASHRHIFDQEDASDGHMAVLGNCTTPTVYYTSCVCGENGTETFHGQTVTNRHNGTATKVIAGASAGEHRVLYICCDAMADEHVPCSGGTATCKDRAWCEMCGAEYGELISEHTYGADGQCTVCYMQKPAIPSVDTDTPLDTDMSLDTDTPLDTDMPLDTDTPLDTDLPLDTDTPLDTDLPLDTDTSSDIDTPSGTDTSSDTDMSMDTTTSPDTNTPADTNAPSDTNKPAAPPSPAGDDTDVIPETKGEVEPDQTATDSKSADDGCGSAISWESAAVVSIVALGMGIISKKRAD